MPEKDYEHDSVTVAVVIESTGLTPEEITSLIGTPWDEARRIGEPRGHSGKSWDRNSWRILLRKRGSEYPGRSAHDLLPVCLEEFLNRLSGISDGLRKVVRSEGGEFAIHVTSTFVPGLSFEPDTIRRIADLGLSMDIDVILYGEGD